MGWASSILGGSSSTGGVSYPTYDMDKAALTGVYGVQSDLGNMSVKKNADGTYSKVYESSDIDKQRNALALQGLSSLSLDPTATQEAYYNQASSLLNKQFGQQQEDLDRQLINRGIQTGTEQYNTTMGNLTDSQNQTLQNLANQAVYMGTSNLGNQISNINALTSGRDIYALSGLSGTNNAYDNYYKSLVAQNVADAQGTSNTASTLGALAGGLSSFF